jgi:hypothetical protein
MKKSTFSPAQIAGILKEFDNGKTAEEIKPLFVFPSISANLIINHRTTVRTARTLNY